MSLQTQTTPAPRLLRLARVIDMQGRRLFQVSAILSCLGNVLDEVHAPGIAAPDLQQITDALIEMLDSIAAKLDPTSVEGARPPVNHAAASAVMEGLREASTQYRPDQAALKTRLMKAAQLIGQLIGREEPS